MHPGTRNLELGTAILTPEAKAEKLHFYLSRGQGHAPWSALYLAIEDVLLREAELRELKMRLRILSDGGP